MNDSEEYRLILQFYGNKTAKRSGVPLVNHIHEGLMILDHIKADEVVKKAYCLHPLVQNDIELRISYRNNMFLNCDINAVLLAIEYRSIANEYLSKRVIKLLDEIRLSPLEEINQMLIADKIQNKKDFMLYHYGKHERSDELFKYFNNWLEKLNSTKLYLKFYKEL